MYINSRFTGSLFIADQAALPIYMNRFEIVKEGGTYYVRIGSVGIHWLTPSERKKYYNSLSEPFFSWT